MGIFQDIHRLASVTSSKHAFDGNSQQSVAYLSSKHVKSQADDRISTYTPKFARLRAGVVATPQKHADSLACGSPAPSTTCEGGGPLGVVGRDDPQGDEDNVLSLHPNDMYQLLLPTQQPVDNKFRQYQTNINKMTEYLTLPRALMQLIMHPCRSHRKRKPSFLTYSTSGHRHDYSINK